MQAPRVPRTSPKFHGWAVVPTSGKVERGGHPLPCVTVLNVQHTQLLRGTTESFQVPNVKLSLGQDYALIAAQKMQHALRNTAWMKALAGVWPPRRILTPTPLQAAHTSGLAAGAKSRGIHFSSPQTTRSLLSLSELLKFSSILKATLI